MLVVLCGPGFELSLAGSSEAEVDFLYAQRLGFPVRLVKESRVKLYRFAVIYTQLQNGTET